MSIPGTAAEPKELHHVAGAGHADLHDRVGLIPFGRPAAFFNRHLAWAKGLTT